MNIIEPKGRIAVLLDEIAEQEADWNDPAAATSTRDVTAALSGLGYEPIEVRYRPREGSEWLRRLADGGFRCAFNLCETVGGEADGEHLAAASVEFLGLPITGARASTLLYCLDKDLCSAVLRSHGVPVPEWRYVAEDEGPGDWNLFPAIVKPMAEDASNGVHATSVAWTRDELQGAVRSLQESWGDLIVQRFIEGREINLAMVGHHILPPAEIDFSTLPDGSPPIVTFEAKWVPGSLEDRGTRPICPAPLEPHVAARLQELAAQAWSLVGGEGYARVDIRLSQRGVPYVIDINPNPDLSIDAGLARQARVAGWSYETLVEMIVDDAFRRSGHPQGNGSGPGRSGQPTAAGASAEDLPGEGWVYLPAVSQVEAL